MYFIKETKKLKLYKTLSLADFETLQKTNSANPVDLFWAYHTAIFENIPVPKKNTSELFWKQLTKAQQVVLTLGIFINQVNNGGVWQFFFNQTEYIAAVGGSLEQFGNMYLWNTFYTRCFTEFTLLLKNGEFKKMIDLWNNMALSFEERWASFKSGEEKIPSRIDFEKYFYSEEGKTRLFTDLNRFIEQNLGQLILIDSGIETKIIEKKNAIPEFTKYISEVTGEVPESVTIYYSANVTIENSGTKLFLMKFKMPNGYESLGITGYFTHHFPDVNFTHIKKMHQRNHKQELINLFYGWYLYNQETPKNTDLHKFQKLEWAETLQNLQDPKRTQIPVNVKFLDCLQYKENLYFKYSGDLYYNQSLPFPDDLSKLPMLSVTDKKSGGYRGELNLVFTTLYNSKPQFGRRILDDSIENLCFWFDLIGRQNKLLKDNPWGF